MSIDNAPDLSIASVSNVWCKMMHFTKAGYVMQGHTHSFDHCTLLAKGSLKVSINGVETIFKAPHIIFISKDKEHELTALEDDTLAFCIHALRDGDGVDDIIDPDMIPYHDPSQHILTEVKSLSPVSENPPPLSVNEQR